MSNRIFTFEELNKKDNKELESVKKVKQEELYSVRQDKHMLIMNILSLQSMIEEEKK